MRKAHNTIKTIHVLSAHVSVSESKAPGTSPGALMSGFGKLEKRDQPVQQPGAVGFTLPVLEFPLHFSLALKGFHLSLLYHLQMLNHHHSPHPQF